MPQERALACDERLPGRPFTDPEHTLADAEIMSRMIDRLRLEASSIEAAGDFSNEPVERLEDAAGGRQWIVLPRPSALLVAKNVTAVGFFGDLRGGTDHAPIYRLELAVVARLGRYADVGLLSYYDAELEPGVHGNLVLFGTAEVPAVWHKDFVHRRAVALAPVHYRSLRLHRGAIPGPFIGIGSLTVQRTRYFDFSHEPAWRGIRRATGTTG